MTNPRNWTALELREKLQSMGISVPKGFTATALRQLYQENINKNNHHVTNQQTIPREEVRDLGGCDVRQPNNTSGEPSQLSGSNVASVNNHGASDNRELLSTLQIMAQSCTALQQTVNTLLEKEKKSDEENPLQRIVTNLGIDVGRGTSEATTSNQGQIRNTGTINTVNIGVPSKEVGHIDLVNPDIRKKNPKG
jgi:hypothetical protein